jgi:hypothetical protein
VSDSERCAKIDDADVKRETWNAVDNKLLVLDKRDLERCKEVAVDKGVDHVAHQSINFYIYVK